MDNANAISQDSHRENTDRRHLKETALGGSRLGYHDVSVYGK
jgi:hypothetical protein